MSPHRSRRMSTNYQQTPIGVVALQKLARVCCPRVHIRKEILFKTSILALTFICYTCYHMSRKPISVVKSVLHTNCTPPLPNKTDCGYPPFDSPDAPKLFGMLDSAFLFSYAAAMFVSGFVAERVSLRYFLSFGMILSGTFTYLFGIAKTWNIHSLWYFVIVQAIAGILQTTGWPGVVTLVGRWFGKSKRGLIFGIWNSHTSIGNILGTLIAAYYVESNWAMSFAVPGIIMGCGGFLLFLFVVDHPEMVGCHTQRSIQEGPITNDSDIEDGEDGANTNVANYYAQNNDSIGNYGYSNDDSEVNNRITERTPILERPAPSISHSRPPIKLIDALYIPGVVEFSLCLFFSKLVSYTFLYWLPLYIQNSTSLGPSYAADLSALFDVGGIVGAIAAGLISDVSGMSATTCTVMLFFASPVLLMYAHYGSISLSINVVLLIVAGVLVNGPYALITTSVSAELGQHSSLEGNAKALATVTAIIDGTGSIGAAVGPLVAGLVSNHGWQSVFNMLIVSDILAMLFLVRLVIKEIAKVRRANRIRIE